MNNVLLVGPNKNLVGGVSTHMQNLACLLSNKGYNILFLYDNRNSMSFSIKGLRKFLKLIYWANIIHIHSGYYINRFFLCFLGFILRKKIIITLHSFDNKSILAFQLTKAALFLSNEKIFVANDIAVRFKYNKSVIPAYIPINKVLNEKESIESYLSPENKILKEKKLLLGISNFVIHNGRDLYGLQEIIDLAEIFKSKKINFVSIIVLVPHIEDKREFKTMVERIKKSKLEKYIHLEYKKISLVELFRFIDIYLRCTITDGDAISVREAIDNNVPVIASDVVKRPQGVITYKYSNSNDLFNKVYYILNQKNVKPQVPKSTNFSDELLKIYTQLI